MRASAQERDASALWLATLQRALARASHDVKDALNGVSVNLEVIRSRALRPGTGADAVAPFAEAATQQLERLTTLVEAVLALGRPEREPVDVGALVRRLAVVCSASASASDGTIRVMDDGPDSVMTTVRGDAVRLAIATPMLGLIASDGGGRVPSALQCRLTADEHDIVVRFADAGSQSEYAEDVATALRDAGVRWTSGTEGSGDFSLVFPRA